MKSTTAHFFLIVIFLILSTFQVSIAQQSENQWFIGRWEGNIDGFRGKSGPGRTLRVHEISKDGTILAMWSVTGQRATKADVRVDNDQVRVVVGGSKSVVEMVREGESSLTGKFTLADGKGFPIKLMKTKLSTEFDGAYSGNNTVGRGCGGMFYDIVVKDSLITGWAQVRGVTGMAVTESTNYITITGELSADGKGQMELRGPRNNSFPAAFIDGEIRATDPPIGNRGCSYDLKLKRK